MNREAAARKIQNIFRTKRVFTNNLGVEGARFSKPVVVSFVATIPGHISLDFSKIPAGFKEVTGFTKGVKNARIRYIQGKWIGKNTGINTIRAKRKSITIEGKKNMIVLSGSKIDDIKDVLKMAHKNGWITATVRDSKPQFRIINGKFNVNRQIDIKDFKDLLNYLPANTFRESPRMHDDTIKGLRQIKALVIKYKTGVTFHVFKNGTVTFTGSEDIEAPREIFKELIKYSDKILTGETHFRLPKNANTPSRLAGRYPLAAEGNWSKVPTYRAPVGYYVRPGTDGLPRLYPYQYLRKLTNGPVVENGPPVNLGPRALIVKKAFEKVGKPIPAFTLQLFRNAGHPLNTPVNENKVKYANTADRRAPGWDATKAGHYVRPGPGKQPYWAKIPAGLGAGRATVIKKYTEAGRNIPSAVRKIFSIGANIKTARNNGPIHTIGMNGSINGRQWRRLTKPELLAVARNMGIAQVSNKTAPADIAAHIIEKAHPKAVKMPAPLPPRKVPSPASPNTNNNFSRELEYGLMLRKNLGNIYENGNESEFMKIYNELPSGSRGKPLKAAINSAYKRFIKNQFLFRGREMPKKPRAPKNQTLNYVYKIPKNAVNFSNILEKKGINTTRDWTWNEIRAALKGDMTAAELKKLKLKWNSIVVTKSAQATGPVKRKLKRT